jgi:hypothetical protein
MTDTTTERENSEIKDRERAKSLYLYLLRCLTDMGIGETSEEKRPNEYKISKQWGQNRIFVRRVLRSVMPEKYSPDDDEKTIPKLTLDKLVEILLSIEEYRKKLPKTDDNMPQALTREEKLMALRKFSQLSLEEQKSLKLSTQSEELLLQKLMDEIVDPVKGLNRQHILSFFRDARTLYKNLKQAEVITEYTKMSNSPQLAQENRTELDPEKKIEKLIRDNITIILKNNTGQESEKLEPSKIEELTRKIKREISRIKYQSGLTQSEYVNSQYNLNQHNGENEIDYFYPLFIHKLTISIVENEIINQDFPIYLKYFEIEKVPPLPLFWVSEKSGEDYQSKALLNSKLLKNKENIQALEQLITYKVKVYFSVKLPENYSWRFGKEESKKYSQFSDDKNGKTDLIFCEVVQGIGSPITHIIAAINRLLFDGIPLLQNYFPVAREVYIKDDLIGQNPNSPVLTHAVVSLCKKEDIENAIKENKKYDEVTNCQDFFHGEYYGFDLVEVSVKAALYARLRAIKNLGINPQEYLQQLCHLLEERNALKKAVSYVEFYPFSLKAMEGTLNETIFKDSPNNSQKNQKYPHKYRKETNYKFEEVDHGEKWSIVAYEAHLKITHAYLREGLYRIAKNHLDILKTHIDKKYLSDILLVKYYLAQFRYYYMTDLGDQEYYEITDRTSAVSKAEESLAEAEKILINYQRTCNIIGQTSQTNFHPFLNLISRFYLHHAKLYIFLPRYPQKRIYGDLLKDKWTTLGEAMCSLEEARMGAARDGSIGHYSYWSAYQAWCYLMTGYLDKKEDLFTKNECIKWAEKLVEEAKSSYSYIGKICYQQIKQNAGKTIENLEEPNKTREINGKYYELYGDVKIEFMPFIHETTKTDLLNEDQPKIPKILDIDLSILKKENEFPSRYLFGIHSSIILFSMGMLKLCKKDDFAEKCIKDQKKCIEDAKKMFIFCSAIAEEGGNEDDKVITRDLLDTEKENIKLDFDSPIKILYPHRLTQFADLGKIFAATCYAILNYQEDECKYNKLYEKLEEGLLKQLGKNPKSRDSRSKILEQTKFNGHLETHIRDIKQYFKELPKFFESLPKNEDLLFVVRDKIVTDIFKIIRGESVRA